MLLVCVGVFSFMSLLALLWIKLDNKKLKDQTDFLTRLNNGEVLSRKNIFQGGKYCYGVMIVRILGVFVKGVNNGKFRNKLY